MKYIITENQSKKIRGMIENYLEMFDYPEVCKITTNFMEGEENHKEFYVHIYFSSEWFDKLDGSFLQRGTRVKKINKIKNEVKDRLEQIFSPISFYIGSSIKEEC